MSKVRVRNLDDKEYREEYRDNMIVIPAGGYVEMGRADAVSFLSQFTPLNQDGAGRVLIPKKLKIEEDPEQHAEHRAQPYRFTAPDGNKFRTQAGYDAYLEILKAEAKEVEDEKPVRRKRVPNTSTTEAKSA